MIEWEGGLFLSVATYLNKLDSKFPVSAAMAVGRV